VPAVAILLVGQFGLGKPHQRIERGPKIALKITLRRHAVCAAEFPASSAGRGGGSKCKAQKGGIEEGVAVETWGGTELQKGPGGWGPGCGGQGPKALRAISGKAAMEASQRGRGRDGSLARGRAGRGGESSRVGVKVQNGMTADPRARSWDL